MKIDHSKVYKSKVELLLEPFNVDFRTINDEDNGGVYFSIWLYRDSKEENKLNSKKIISLLQENFSNKIRYLNKGSSGDKYFRYIEINLKY